MTGSFLAFTPKPEYSPLNRLHKGARTNLATLHKGAHLPIPYRRGTIPLDCKGAQLLYIPHKGARSLTLLHKGASIVVSAAQRCTIIDTTLLQIEHFTTK